MKNVTVTMDDAVAEWVRVEAARRGSSVSRLLGEWLAEKMRQEDAYAQAMREVAQEQKVALIDLQAMSIRIYEALGPAIAPGAFADGGNDKTHHNEYGARLLARAVVEAVRTSDLTLTGRLAEHLVADAGIFDPGKPPLP